MRKTLSIFLLMIGFSVREAQAHGEMIMVQTKIDGGIHSVQFTLNGQPYSVCTGGSEYCPNRIFISIDPNKEYTFILYGYQGSSSTISDSCRKKITVTPNHGQTITVVRSGTEISCSSLF